MDAATLARATEPFFTTKGVGVGTGLGLSMAKGFAEQSGGALGIESTPGRGHHGHAVAARGRLRGGAGPAMPDTAAAGARAAAGAAAAGACWSMTRTWCARTIAAIWRTRGFACCWPATDAEALALLAAGEAVDVLVTDLSMPGMDGLAIIRAAQARRPGLPAVLLTGYARRRRRSRRWTGRRGRFSLLRKPVRGGELVQRIHETIRDVQGSAVDPHGTQRPIAQSASTPQDL